MNGGPEPLDLERGDAYGRSFGDVYDRWYDGVTDAEATADFVTARHRGGIVLELGVGTGRLAGPLAARGLTVVGLDASSAMLARGPARAGRLHRVGADMRALPFPASPGDPPFGTVLLAFNTLFNLTTADAQAELLVALGPLVRPDGLLIIEVLDVSALTSGPDRAIGRRDRSTDPVVITATALDRASQRLWGQHLEITDRGVRLRPWMVRWTTPDQLDAMAGRAGFTLVDRFADWRGRPDGEAADSGAVISAYQPASGGCG